MLPPCPGLPAPERPVSRPCVSRWPWPVAAQRPRHVAQAISACLTGRPGDACHPESTLPGAGAGMLLGLRSPHPLTQLTDQLPSFQLGRCVFLNN